MAKEPEPKRGLSQSVVTRIKILALFGLAAAAGVSEAVLNACSGGGKNEVAKTSTPVPTKESTPTLVPTAEPTPTPKPEPTPTPTSEVWTDEDIAAKLFSVRDSANSVADAYPKSQLLGVLKADTQTAFEAFKQVLKTKDYSSALEPLNGFGNVGTNIGQFICFTTDGKGEPEGKAWVDIKDFVLKVGLQYEKAGYLEAGMTETFKEAFFTFPEVCPNPNGSAILNN